MLKILLTKSNVKQHFVLKTDKIQCAFVTESVSFIKLAFQLNFYWFLLKEYPYLSSLLVVPSKKEHEEYCAQQYAEGAHSGDNDLCHHLHVTGQGIWNTANSNMKK